MFRVLSVHENITFNRYGTDTGGYLEDGGNSKVCTIKNYISFLIVDDNKINILVLKKMLQSIGVSDIYTSTDGKHCITLTKQKNTTLF